MDDGKAGFSVELWPRGQGGHEPCDAATICVYSSDRRDDACIIICPGGGYVFHAEYEADPIAQWLNTLGVTGIVLRYRLAPRHRHPAAFDDLTRAIRLTRERASEWGIDPKRIGVMGFSAGGHLAAHVSCKWDAGDPAAADPVERFSSRPDLAVLLYPVISFTELSSHTATTKNLLGDRPTREVIESLSFERHVTASTPPTFLYHASGDPNVPVINSMLYGEALRRQGVSFEMHLYDRVAHGVGLATGDPVLHTWPRLCATWLHSRGFGRSVGDGGG